MSPTQTISAERRSTLGPYQQSSVAIPTQKRRSTAIDWFLQSSDNATKRRSQIQPPMTALTGDERPKAASGSYFDRTQVKRVRGKQRAQSVTPLTPIHEDAPPKARAQSITLAQLSRVDSDKTIGPQSKLRSSWSKRMSWVPGWSFGGSSTLDDVEERSDTASLTKVNTNEGRRMSRFAGAGVGSGIGRRLSSFSQSVAEFQEAVNEPSHETNFPAPIPWPSHPGTKTTVPIYGTVDALSEDGMRVLSPCGARRVSFTGKASMNDELLAQDFCSRLKDGDMLCEDAKLGRDSGLAMVLRGDMQQFNFKCSVVGLFPMKLLAGEKELPEPYLMDVVVY